MYWTAGQSTAFILLTCFNLRRLDSPLLSRTYGFFPFSLALLYWAVSGRSTTGHRMDTLPHPLQFRMFHAGVLMKLGAFAALRVGIMLLPEGAQHWSWLIMLCAAVAVVYGAFIAFVQTDLNI